MGLQGVVERCTGCFVLCNVLCRVDPETGEVLRGKDGLCVSCSPGEVSGGGGGGGKVEDSGKCGDL